MQVHEQFPENACRIFQNVPACIRMFQLFQNTCRSMKVYELACSYIRLNAVTKACMELHELSCRSMSLQVHWVAYVIIVTALVRKF